MSKKERVWIIDDDRAIRWVLEKALKQADMEIESFESALGVLDAINRKQPDALITDIRMPGMDGLDLLKEIHGKYPKLPVIIMTAHSDLDSAVSAYQGGAFEYLPKPFDVDEAVDLVKRAVQYQRNQEIQQENCRGVSENPKKDWLQITERLPFSPNAIRGPSAAPRSLRSIHTDA